VPVEKRSSAGFGSIADVVMPVAPVIAPPMKVKVVWEMKLVKPVADSKTIPVMTIRLLLELPQNPIPLTCGAVGVGRT